MSLKNPDYNDYEPSTIRSIFSSIERHLKTKSYSKSLRLMIGLEFSKLREVIKTKQKLLKAQGRGNLPNRAQALTDDDVDKLWQSSEMGTNTQNRY